MLKARITIEDESGHLIEKTVVYEDKSLHLGTFSAIETLMEDFKQASFPAVEAQLLLFQQAAFEKKVVTSSKESEG
jgi:hypothetical protein